MLLLCIGHELSTARHHILGEHFRQPISKRFIQAKLFTPPPLLRGNHDKVNLKASSGPLDTNSVPKLFN